MPIKLTKSLLKSTVLGYVTFRAYHQYYDLYAPEPVDFKSSKDKPKTIVVVGSGMVGLTTAYYLGANHPLNKVILLERNAVPYQGTS